MRSFVIHLVYTYLGSTVGVGYRLRDWDTEVLFQSSQRTEIIPLCKRSRPALGIIQLHIQRVPWVLSSGINRRVRGWSLPLL